MDKNSSNFYQIRIFEPFVRWDRSMPFALLSPEQMIQILKEKFINDIAGLILEYCIFDLDLSQYDLSMCYLQFSFPCHSWYNYTHVLPEIQMRTRDLVKEFQIDCLEQEDILRYETCKIFMQKFTEKQFSRRTRIKYVNMIEFSPEHKIELEFYDFQSDILIQIDSYDRFVAFLEAMYYVDPDINKREWFTGSNGHLFAWSMDPTIQKRLDKQNEQKMKQVWEIWRKVFAPKFVLDNLTRLTGWDMFDEPSTN